MKVSVIIDARAADRDLFPDGDVKPFLESWALLERSLVGRSLSAGTTIEADMDPGRVAFTFIAPEAFTVTPETRFAVVAVREPSIVRAPYRCRLCQKVGRRTYGPFICHSCSDENRVCDDHVTLLPGSLTPVCHDHHPKCRAPGCGAAAQIWCPGPQCRSRQAWCSAHSRSHGDGNKGVRHCDGCLVELFPPCAQLGCSAVGSVRCEHVTDTGAPCGERMCPRHARIWQVYGPQRDGLGRCTRHSRMAGMDPEDVLVQVLGGSMLRGQRPPTLASLRYLLMKAAGGSFSMGDAARIAEAAPRRHRALELRLSDFVRKNQATWRKQAEGVEAIISQNFGVLQQWLRMRGELNAVNTLEAAGWGRARDGEPGKLFVRGDPRYFPRRVRDQAEEALGFAVRMERSS